MALLYFSLPSPSNVVETKEVEEVTLYGQEPIAPGYRL
jgi:hypothetical protein